jgi:GAF domain-containing protein
MVDWASVVRELENLLEGETDPVARMTTIAAVLKARDARISWVGYYRLLEPDLLVVGPFQGPTACLRIRRGQGVCGTALAREEAILVPDVHRFPGHIACDPLARSEVVVPVRDPAGRIRGVLDVDSHREAAFQASDLEGLQAVAALTFPSSSPGE